MEKRYKYFNVRITHDLWVFIKNFCVENDTKMTKVIIKHFEKLRRKLENNKKIVEKGIDE